MSRHPGAAARLWAASPTRRSRTPSASRTSPKRLWSESYSAESVGGAPIYVMRQYIEQQDRRE